jgi:hypothetical protein
MRDVPLSSTSNDSHSSDNTPQPSFTSETPVDVIPLQTLSSQHSTLNTDSEMPSSEGTNVP